MGILKSGKKEIISSQGQLIRNILLPCFVFLLSPVLVLGRRVVLFNIAVVVNVLTEFYVATKPSFLKCLPREVGRRPSG